MAESEVKCFSGVQRAQNSKMEGGIKRTKNENVKLKKEDVPGAILPRENAPWNSFRDGFFAVEPKQPERKCSWIRLAFGIQKNATPGESRHNSRWLLDLSPPPPIPINECALSLGPRLSFHSEVSYWWTTYSAIPKAHQFRCDCYSYENRHFSLLNVPYLLNAPSWTP